MFDNSHGVTAGNFNGAIGTARIDNDDIIGQLCRFNARGDVNFFVVSQNINRELTQPKRYI